MPALWLDILNQNIMGKKHKYRSRSIQIKFFVNKKERVLIEKRAKSFKSLSEYLRDIATEGEIIERTPSITLEHFTELNRIGHNINQMARRINSSEANIFHRRTKAELKALFEELQPILINNIDLIQHVIRNP